MRFREFLNEATEDAHSLADIASIVHANKICFKYDGVYFSGSPQYHIRGFDSHSSSKIFYASNNGGGTVRVFWLKGKKPFLVVREDVHGKPIEIDVLNDAEFVKAALGDITDKERILKILLKKYKEEMSGYDGVSDVVWHFEETREFMQTLISSMRKIGINWKELDAIDKSLKKEGLQEALEITPEIREKYQKWKSLVNMPSSTLRKFLQSKEGKEAGLSRAEASALGIGTGHQSASAILKMREKPLSSWSSSDISWMNRQISFISRMSGNKGPMFKVDREGKKIPTRKLTSLWLWGNSPAGHPPSRYGI